MEDLKRKLQEEITSLEYELRNELPKEILKARAHGDLRENAEFHAAKERQRFVDARLAQLKKRLSEVALVDMTKSLLIELSRARKRMLPQVVSQQVLPLEKVCLPSGLEMK